MGMLGLSVCMAWGMWAWWRITYPPTGTFSDILTVAGLFATLIPLLVLAWIDEREREDRV